MPSIKFDNSEILNTTYIPRFMKHESAPERILNTLDLARDDGSVLISEKRGKKTISLQGVLTASSESGLETAIDTFKELFSRKEKNLDVNWEAGTRRYVATCVNHNFDRDYFNQLFVPWTADFVVIGGIGSSTILTAEKNEQAITTTIYNWTSTFAGSSKPKPLITITFVGSPTNPRGFAFRNLTTGEEMVYTQKDAFPAGSVIVIDYETRIIKYYATGLTGDYIEASYYGVFPSLEVGANSLELEFGEILDQVALIDMDWPGFAASIYGDWKVAMSFSVPYKDTTYASVELFIGKEGTPPEDVYIRIETDNNGEPSGSPLAEITIPKASVPAYINSNYIKAIFPSLVTFEANTRYWISVHTALGGGSNYYILKSLRPNATPSHLPYINYKKGGFMTSADSGATWENQTGTMGYGHIGFKMNYAGTKDANMNVLLDIDYYKKYL